ncbi:MAG: CDP-diacylglycerol--serine O-phosphatidyltransferase [Vicinamibacterales bacterium]|nr:CDP-diacylglycerol--serine O-phosphatidyltransferase [Vicinamibacterales bacterium]
MLTPHRRRTDIDQRRVRRGVYLLPSLMTLGNMFCGYACIVYAMRGEYETAAPFIGVAMVLDTLDGRIARMTGTTSEFGLQFDSLADVISFGIAPAILTFSWGLTSLGRWGWAAGFVYVTAAAMRLARFNIQSGSVDKKYFAGMPSPAAATVPASTIFAYPAGFQHPIGAIPVLALVLVPAFLMVSTIKFRSFKTFDLQARRSYTVLIAVALLIALVFAHPALALVTLSYGYLLSAFIEMAAARIRHRGEQKHPASTSPNVVEHRPRF